jgi:hypothetical protein
MADGARLIFVTDGRVLGSINAAAKVLRISRAAVYYHLKHPGRRLGDGLMISDRPFDVIGVSPAVVVVLLALAQGGEHV